MEAAKREEEEWRYPAGDEDIGRPKMELEDGGSGRRMRNGRRKNGRKVGGRRRMWRGRRMTGMHTTGWIRMWMWRRRKRCGSRGDIGAGGGVPGHAASGGRGGGGKWWRCG